LLGCSLESDIYATQLAPYPSCIDAVLLFCYLRSQSLKLGLAWLTRKWLGCTIRVRGPGKNRPEADARSSIHSLNAK
ncbi:hypothetical protein H4582DRAFT_1793265, partial [Lactarius indigo]